MYMVTFQCSKDESLAEEGGYSSATGTNSGEVVSSALVVPTNQATEGHHRLQGENGTCAHKLCVSMSLTPCLVNH